MNGEKCEDKTAVRRSSLFFNTKAYELKIRPMSLMYLVKAKLCPGQGKVQYSR